MARIPQVIPPAGQMTVAVDAEPVSVAHLAWLDSFLTVLVELRTYVVLNPALAATPNIFPMSTLAVKPASTVYAILLRLVSTGLEMFTQVMEYIRGIGNFFVELTDFVLERRASPSGGLYRIPTEDQRLEGLQMKRKMRDLKSHLRNERCGYLRDAVVNDDFSAERITALRGRHCGSSHGP